MLPLALDAMGGDNAPHSVIKGAAIARKKLGEEISFLFVGDEAVLGPLIQKNKFLRKCSEILHTTDFVAATDKPSHAVRNNKQSSMKIAIEAVKNGRASGVVSAGNTGAFMALSKMVLKTLPGISRPAIAATVPTNLNDVVMLDLGANVQCDARDLCQFAIMGDAYAKAVLGVEKPHIGLLNIGSEDTKGHEELQQAAQMLKDNATITFKGFIEGDKIPAGKIHVIVADGFTGNVALKCMEGTAAFISRQLKLALKSSFWGKLSYVLARPAFFALKKRLDPRRYNGAIFLGLNGVAVKSHGGADAYAFSHAIRKAYRIVQGDVNARIIEEITLVKDSFRYSVASVETSAVTPESDIKEAAV